MTLKNIVLEDSIKLPIAILPLNAGGKPRAKAHLDEGIWMKAMTFV